MRLAQKNPSDSKYDLCRRSKSQMDSLVGPTTPFGAELGHALDLFKEKCVESGFSTTCSTYARLISGWGRTWEGTGGLLADDVNATRANKGKVRLLAGKAATPVDVSQLKAVGSILHGSNYQFRMGSMKAHWDAAKYELVSLVRYELRPFRVE